MILPASPPPPAFSPNMIKGRLGSINTVVHGSSCQPGGCNDCQFQNVQLPTEREWDWDLIAERCAEISSHCCIPIKQIGMRQGLAIWGGFTSNVPAQYWLHMRGCQAALKLTCRNHQRESENIQTLWMDRESRQLGFCSLQTSRSIRNQRLQQQCTATLQ